MDVHGNRGKCAQPCRLPYELISSNTLLTSTPDNSNTHNNETSFDIKCLSKGYLLSTKDLCGLEYIPSLIEAGVNCFKIEGRMKSPEYVATVTRIYRKYIDLAYSSSPYVIEEADKTSLLQVFNRGGFSSGHLDVKPNRELVFKDKQNHMGIYLGNVSNVKSQKGHVLLNLDNPLSIGDTIQFEHETSKYTVSELMSNNNNIKTASTGLVEIGRMKGNIKIGDKIFKIQSKELSNIAYESYQKENKKVLLDAKITIKLNSPIKLDVKVCNTENSLFKGIKVSAISSITPVEATSKPIDEERIRTQLNKTNNTIFEFQNIKITLDKNVFVPSISSLNELRRNILDQILEIATNRIGRTSKLELPFNIFNGSKTTKQKTKLSLLLNIINLNYDYTKLEGADNVYIPLKYFEGKKYISILQTLCEKFNVYIYLPSIEKANYRNILSNLIDKSIDSYNIKGFVVSNISCGNFIKEMKKKYPNRFEYIANYTLNIYNLYTKNELKNMGIRTFTISPELDKESTLSLCNTISLENNVELIVYGATPLMTINYCLLGDTNKCYPNCKTRCLEKIENKDTICLEKANSKEIEEAQNIELNEKSEKNKETNTKKISLVKKYYLKDRMGFYFRVLPDRIQTITTIYNSKILSLSPTLFNATSYRIDVLDETIDEINNIINTVSSGNRMEGKNYTNGNMNREI